MKIHSGFQVNVKPNFFRKLAWSHWVHASLLLFLFSTGLFLYFPNLRTQFVEYHMAIRSVHLAVSFLYVLLVLISLPSVASYASRLKHRIGKRLHLVLVYAAAGIWTMSGLVMWGVQLFPVSWRQPAVLMHDSMTVLLVPWFLSHIGLVLTRRYFVKPSSSYTAAGKLITRRELLLGGSLLLGSFLAGMQTKWYWPALQPLADVGTKRRGQFRLYNVVSQTPVVSSGNYRLIIDGLVTHPAEYNLSQLRDFPQITIRRDFHCVSGWSVTDVEWTGVPLSYLLQKAKLMPEANYMTVYSLDGLYTDSYTLDQLTQVDVLLALRLDGNELSAVQGWPCRIVFPGLYGYKSVKWIHRIEFTREREIGYWEQRGYDLNGYLPAK